MTDTERLDAIPEYGLSVARHDHLGPAGWTERWFCHYEDKVVIGMTMREAIDMAVMDIRTCGQLAN